MNREDSAKVGGWLDHASKMARTVAEHNAEETIAALTAERDNALAALRRRSSQRDQLDARCEELVGQRAELTARAERAEAALGVEQRSHMETINAKERQVARAQEAEIRAMDAEAAVQRVGELADRWASREPHYTIEFRDAVDELRAALDSTDPEPAPKDLWNLVGGPKPGFCCQDAYASSTRSAGTEVLHTSGCANRCSKWVPTQRTDGPGAYPCALTAGHLGDCWLHPDYRAPAGTHLDVPAPGRSGEEKA